MVCVRTDIPYIVYVRMDDIVTRYWWMRRLISRERVLISFIILIELQTMIKSYQKYFCDQHRSWWTLPVCFNIYLMELQSYIKWNIFPQRQLRLRAILHLSQSILLITEWYFSLSTKMKYDPNKTERNRDPSRINSNT